jgi:methyl-accepting chemotaxis protein
LVCILLVMLTAVTGTVGLTRVAEINSRLQLIVTDPMPGMYLMSQLEIYCEQMHGDMYAHVSFPQHRAEMDKDLDELKAKVQNGINDYEKTITTARDRELFSRIRPAFTQFMAAWDRVRPLSLNNQSKEALELYSAEGIPARKALEKALSDEVDLNKAQGDADAEAGSQSVVRARYWISALMIISLVAGGALTFFSVTGINRVLNRCVTELSEGSGQITSAASQVASSSQSLAQGSSEQAASLEETSASTEEITSMTRKNAENSKSAAEVMAKVDREVQDGNQTLEQMVASMQQINASSDKISKIIKVIDEIAFQTNILALNAAVEAARAGEAGMGGGR